jgi:hypothetical protein
MKSNRPVQHCMILWSLLAVFCFRCTNQSSDPAANDDETKTLQSLVKIDDYPLYVMNYYGGYGFGAYLKSGDAGESNSNYAAPDTGIRWGCTCFAAMKSGGNFVFGRNFDWYHRPSLLLFTNPPDAYASVSMVDLYYLGYRDSTPLTSMSDRHALLSAPSCPFDGLNEKGVAIGMMALPEAQAPFNPRNKSLNSLQVIRLVLDYAKNTEEAIGLIQKYNVQMDGGPPIHYLIADVSGKSAVAEFVSGRMEVIRNLEPWQVSTNFTIYGSAALTSPLDAPCWRYRTVYKALSESGGRISQEGAVDLLNSSSQATTIWSIAYGMSTGDISVAVGRKYSEVKKYRLQMSN